MDLVIKKLGKLFVLKIIGEFYLKNILEIDKTWNDLINEMPGIVAFDCSKMTFIDSSAIGTLVKFVNDSKKRNIEVVFVSLNSSVRKIFDATRLDKMLNVISGDEFESEYLQKYQKTDS